MITTHTDAERSIQHAIHYIVSAIDEGNAILAADYFTDDGIIAFSGKPPYNSEFSGIKNIRIFFQQRQDNKELLTRHLVSNLIINEQQDGTYRANYIFNVFRGKHGESNPLENIICDVCDLFRITDGDLKIIRREVNPIFSL